MSFICLFLNNGQSRTSVSNSPPSPPVPRTAPLRGQERRNRRHDPVRLPRRGRLLSHWLLRLPHARRLRESVRSHVPAVHKAAHRSRHDGRLDGGQKRAPKDAGRRHDTTSPLDSFRHRAPCYDPSDNSSRVPPSWLNQTRPTPRRGRSSA